MDGSINGAWRGEPLAVELRSPLEEWLDADLAAVRCHHGRYARWVCRRLGAGAVTVGRRVFFSPAGWRQVEQGGAAGLALAGHEVVHVLQYRRHGVVGMLARYLGAYLRGRLAGRSHRSAYRAIGFEREAFAVEARLRELAAVPEAAPASGAGERKSAVDSPP